MRMRIEIIRASILGLSAVCLPAQASASDPPRTLVGLTAEAMLEPWRIPGDDARDNLAYSLRLTNLLTVPGVINAVSVRDERGKRLQLLTELAPTVRPSSSWT